ncbi:MAG: hypothetical protein GY851_25885 [bacterium]|nr:hypothetical protein [bacterium]
MPIITARLFEYEDLKDRLKPEERIAIFSCDGCAKQSGGLGGEEGLNNLADKLVADGFDVVRRELLPFACSPEQWNERLEDEALRTLFQEANVVIPLSCTAGEDTVNGLLPGVRILNVTKILGKGTYSPETGARLTEPAEDVELDIDDPEGIPLDEAAKRLGLYPGSF